MTENATEHQTTVHKAFRKDIKRWLWAVLVVMISHLAIGYFVAFTTGKPLTVNNALFYASFAGPALLASFVIGCVIANGKKIWTLILVAGLIGYHSFLHPRLGFAEALLPNTFVPLTIVMIGMLAMVRLTKDIYIRTHPDVPDTALSYPAVGMYAIIIAISICLTSQPLYDALYPVLFR